MKITSQEFRRNVEEARLRVAEIEKALYEKDEIVPGTMAYLQEMRERLAEAITTQDWSGAYDVMLMIEHEWHTDVLVLCQATRGRNDSTAQAG
jgi:hypothetical protein